MSPILLKLSGILVLGIGSFWVADTMNIPSILLLLVVGFIAGPMTEFINPDQLFGEFLFPIISLAVAIILFEGGLRLRFNNLKKVRYDVISLSTVGVFLTASMSSLLGWWLLNFNPEVAVLFGSILVITGPTVIIPILRSMDIRGRIRTLSTGEGIVNDPLGSILAVTVFELTVVHNPPGTILLMDGIFSFGKTIGIGMAVSITGAIFLHFALKNEWIPSHLQNPVTLATVITVFVTAEFFEPESGLVAAPLMGIILANQASTEISEILRFKEEIGIVLLGIIFILLSARFDLQGFQQIGFRSFILLVTLVVVVRPVSVIISLIFSELNWNEIIALSFFAPRGIVAATVASLFSLKLIELGYPEAGQLDAEIFFIIASTVLIYGLLVPPLFNYLSLGDHE